MKPRGIAVVVVALVLSLAGCATGPSLSGSSTSATPTPTPDPFATREFEGVGLAEFEASPVPLPIPEGAQSLAVEFACDGGEPFSVEFGDGMAQGWGWFTGTCDGPREWTMPVDAHTPVLKVTVPEGVEWTAQATFSPEPFVSDAALETDCDAFSSVYSALNNADMGFTSYSAFGEDEWKSRVDAAAAELEEARATSASRLVEPFAEVLAHITDPARVTGEAILGPVPVPAVATISEACQANGTEIIIMAEFGG